MITIAILLLTSVQISTSKRLSFAYMNVPNYWGPPSGLEVQPDTEYGSSLLCFPSAMFTSTTNCHHHPYQTDWYVPGKDMAARFNVIDINYDAWFSQTSYMQTFKDCLLYSTSSGSSILCTFPEGQVYKDFPLADYHKELCTDCCNDFEICLCNILPTSYTESLFQEINSSDNIIIGKSGLPYITQFIWNGFTSPYGEPSPSYSNSMAELTTCGIESSRPITSSYEDQNLLTSIVIQAESCDSTTFSVTLAGLDLTNIYNCIYYNNDHDNLCSKPISLNILGEQVNADVIVPLTFDDSTGKHLVMIIDEMDEY